MSVGLINPIVPLANDVIMGEFKAYLNYDTPSELLIGSTDGGCKVTIDKKVKPVKFDGQYSDYYLDSSGNPLVRVDTMDAMITLNQLYLKYIHDKVISDCESDDNWESNDWAGTGGTYTAETTIKNEGNQSAKLTAGTASYGIHNVFSATKDFTVFDNGETSVVGDYIGFAIYISTQDKIDLGSADLRIAFHNDSEGTETNYHYYDIAASALTANQWTSFKIAKSSFTTQGSGVWTGKTGVSLKLSGSPGAEVVCYIDNISLIQNQSNSFSMVKQGGAFDYTDHSTYREWTPDLEITKYDYFQNITLISQKMDGKMVKIILERCLNEGNLSQAMQEKKEVVNGIEFYAHYDINNPSTFPLKIREYVA